MMIKSFPLFALSFGLFNVFAVDGYNFMNTTCLHQACVYGTVLEIEPILKDTSVNINATDEDFNTPLHIASNNGLLSVVQLLITYGADINARNANLDTAIHLAAMNGHENTVDFLLGQSRDLLNTQNAFGNTPLHMGSIYGENRGVIEFLLNSGADGNIRNQFQKTPFEVAEEKHLKEMINVFENCIKNLPVFVAIYCTAIYLVQNVGRCIYSKIVVELGKCHSDGLLTINQSICMYHPRRYSPSFYALSDAKPRGICCIVNNVKFDNMAERTGAHIDTISIENKFTEFNYEIVKYIDETSEEMLAAIRKTVDEYDGHPEYDSLVVFIMSHGSKVDIYGSDGYSKNIEDFIDPIYRSTALRNKPKLIFVQACRGNYRPVEDDDGKDCANQVVNKCHSIISFSTTSGCVSYRQTDGQGSYFVQSICQQFNGEEVICRMLRKVGADVEERAKRDRGIIQIPEYYSRMRKVFKFGIPRI